MSLLFLNLPIIYHFRVKDKSLTMVHIIQSCCLFDLLFFFFFPYVACFLSPILGSSLFLKHTKCDSLSGIWHLLFPLPENILFSLPLILHVSIQISPFLRDFPSLQTGTPRPLCYFISSHKYQEIQASHQDLFPPKPNSFSLYHAEI